MRFVTIVGFDCENNPTRSRDSHYPPPQRSLLTQTLKQHEATKKWVEATKKRVVAFKMYDNNERRVYDDHHKLIHADASCCCKDERND